MTERTSRSYQILLDNNAFPSVFAGIHVIPFNVCTSAGLYSSLVIPILELQTAFSSVVSLGPLTMLSSSEVKLLLLTGVILIPRAKMKAAHPRPSVR